MSVESLLKFSTTVQYDATLKGYAAAVEIAVERAIEAGAPSNAAITLGAYVSPTYAKPPALPESITFACQWSAPVAESAHAE